MKTWAGHLLDALEGIQTMNCFLLSVPNVTQIPPSSGFTCDTEITTFVWVSLGRKLWLHENFLDIGLASATGKLIN